MNKEELAKKLSVANIWNNPATKHKTTQIDDCEYCGKPVGKNPLHVHVTINGNCVPIDVTDKDLEENGEISQGCFPIGNCCAKKLFGSKIKEYCFKYEK